MTRENKTKKTYLCPDICYDMQYAIIEWDDSNNNDENENKNAKLYYALYYVITMLLLIQ